MEGVINGLKEFFGIGGYQRTPEGALSWQHLLFVGSLLLIMTVLAILLGVKARGKSLKEKNKALIYSAILIDGVELLKIVMFCVNDGDLSPIRTSLPLFLCSIQLIAIPMAAFCTICVS